ncbi:hypothetical protein OJ998_32395 [Solirubrobacter taibaiensis]|nr:hypothetical protein [Solirubrobacter taibaiensis]
MLKGAALLLASLAIATSAQAQTPEAWIDERPLAFAGWEGAPATAAQGPNVLVAPGGTLTLRFADPTTTVDVPPGIGTLTQQDGHLWTLTLDPRRVASFPLPVTATLAGEVHAGVAQFFASVAVQSHAVSDANLRRGVVRAVVRVPARGTIRAYVRVNGKRRSAAVTRTFSAAGERRLRLTVRRPGTAWLVTQYTFPGAQPVEVSQRLKA